MFFHHVILKILFCILSLLPLCNSSYVYNAVGYGDYQGNDTDVVSATLPECWQACCDLDTCLAFTYDDQNRCFRKNPVSPLRPGLIRLRYSGLRDPKNCSEPITMWLFNQTSSLVSPPLVLTNLSSYLECADYCTNSTNCLSMHWSTANSSCAVYHQVLNHTDRSQVYYEATDFVGIKSNQICLSYSYRSVPLDSSSSTNTLEDVIILAVSLPLGAGFLLAIVGTLVCIRARRRKKKEAQVQNQIQEGVEVELEKKWEIDFKEINIIGEIGQGGYGTVYKATWRKSDCAVKQLNIHQNDITAIKEFLKEANIVRNLRAHKNVCTIFGICSNPEHPICIVMEYVGGGSLESLIMKNKMQLTPLVIVRLAKDIASGMSHIHQENILHCDLACRNLLVVKDEEDKYLVKVTDFGLARNSKTDVYQASKDAKFPIRWSAPEVLSGRKLSRGADVWSFGVVLWEILEARIPFFEFENKHVIVLVCEKHARLPKPTRVIYPDEVWNIMKECWKEDPTQRPSFDNIFTQLQSLESEMNSNSSVDRFQETKNRSSPPIQNSDYGSGLNNSVMDVNPVAYGTIRDSLYLNTEDKPPTPPVERLMDEAKPPTPPLEEVLISNE